MSQAGVINSSSGPVTPTNPLQTISDFDDFIGNPINKGPKLGWTFINNALEQAPGTATNPGIIFNTTDALDTAILMADNNGITPGSTAPFLLGGGTLSISWLMDLKTLSDGVDRYIAYIGLTDLNVQDAFVSEPQNGCYFKYSDNINSGNWQIICGDAGVYTTVNTATAASTGFHNLTVVVNADATEAIFKIDGVTVGSTILTNIPTAISVGPVVSFQNILGNIPAFELDLFYYRQTLTTARPG